MLLYDAFVNYWFVYAKPSW